MNVKTISGLALLSAALLSGCSAPKTEPAPLSLDVDHSALVDQWVEHKVLQPEGLPTDSSIRYLHGSADLNSDGSLEHLVLMQDRYFCGSGGCTALIFSSAGEVIHTMTVTKMPILLTDHEHNGWKDIIVWSDNNYRSIEHNGVHYPTNPSLAPTIDRSETENEAKLLVVQTELYQQDGYDITPIMQNRVLAPENIYHFRFKHYGDPFSNYYATVNIVNKNVDIEIVSIN